MLQRIMHVIAALALNGLAANIAAAQTGSLRIIHGVQAGASTDTIARLLAEKLRITFGENVMVELRPGAGQRIAMAELQKSPADGRTILLSASALYSIIPHVYGEQAGFDPFKDVLPITRVVVFHVGIAAAPQLGVSNIAEFIAWAKANPGKASFGSPGAGTSSHFTGLLIANAIGIPLVHVPYRGGAPALADLMAGHIQLVTTSISDFPEHHRAGKLKILASAGTQRSRAAPEIPTLKEQGVDVEFDAGFDMHLKAGASQDIVKRLNAAIVKAIREPDVSAKLENMGLLPSASTPEELAKWQQAEYRLWAGPVKASGYKGD